MVKESESEEEVVARCRVVARANVAVADLYEVT